MGRPIRLAAAALAIVCVLAAPLDAQRMTRRVFVSATDGTGAPVRGLARADFTLTEGGRPREIARVAADVPMRVLLLVDSSSTIGPMITTVRRALDAFGEAIAPGFEVGFITTAGQLKIRVPPGTDRQKLRSAFQSFSPDLGGNVIIDALLEADDRFLKTAADRWPVVVLVTTDAGSTRGEPLILRYNKFLNDFRARGGSAHAVVIQGTRPGAISDIVTNLVHNTNGVLELIGIGNPLPEKMKGLAVRISADHSAMAGRYELEYASDQKAETVEVGVLRDGVSVRVSPTRPF